MLDNNIIRGIRGEFRSSTFYLDPPRKPYRKKRLCTRTAPPRAAAASAACPPTSARSARSTKSATESSWSSRTPAECARPRRPHRHCPPHPLSASNSQETRWYTRGDTVGDIRYTHPCESKLQSKNSSQGVVLSRGGVVLCHAYYLITRLRSHT